MKHLIALTSILLIAFCIGCGGHTHESLQGEALDTMKKMIAVLENVKDEASAKSAKAELKSLAEKLNDLNARQSKLGMPTENEIEAMDDKYGKEMDEVGRKFQGQVMRIMFDPKISAELNDINMSMNTNMK